MGFGAIAPNYRLPIKEAYRVLAFRLADAPGQSGLIVNSRFSRRGVCLQTAFLNEARPDRRNVRLGIAKRVRRRASATFRTLSPTQSAPPRVPANPSTEV